MNTFTSPFKWWQITVAMCPFEVSAIPRKEKLKRSFWIIIRLLRTYSQSLSLTPATTTCSLEWWNPIFNLKHPFNSKIWSPCSLNTWIRPTRWHDHHSCKSDLMQALIVLFRNCEQIVHHYRTDDHFIRSAQNVVFSIDSHTMPAIPGPLPTENRWSWSSSPVYVNLRTTLLNSNPLFQSYTIQPEHRSCHSCRRLHHKLTELLRVHHQ